MTIGKRIKDLREKKGISQQQLAEVIGIAQSSIAAWETDESAPRQHRLAKLAEALGSEPKYILFGDISYSKTAPSPLQVQSNAQPAHYHFQGGAHIDLPLLGMAEANRSKDYASFELGTKPIRVVERPPHLFGVDDAFAVYVIGDSMEPRFKSGEIVYINPRMPYQQGNDILIKMKDGATLIKELVREDAEFLTLRQHTPKKEIRLKKESVEAVMRIVGTSGV